MKTKVHSLFLGLALLARLDQSNAQVTNLGIAPVAGGQSLLYWPVSTTNYVLQTVTNLASTNWLTARTAFAVKAAEVTNVAPTGFFRLMPTTTPAGMALIPAGWFTMGNSIGDSDITDANPTNVYVSAFVMDVNLVTYCLWTNVYSYATNNGYYFENTGLNGGTGTNYPVLMVDWFDCAKWCNARSQQAGLTPCYYTDAGFTQVFTNGDIGTAVYQDLTVNGYRLPTEAEWEKAARGGGIGLRFPWGNLIHTNQAQYVACTGCYSYDLGPDNSPSGLSPVGSFDLNGYVSTTWRGVYSSGVGTGMGRRMASRAQSIQPEWGQDRASVCCAAAIGPSAPTSRGAPTAKTASRTMPAATALGFGV